MSSSSVGTGCPPGDCPSDSAGLDPDCCPGLVCSFGNRIQTGCRFGAQCYATGDHALWSTHQAICAIENPLKCPMFSSARGLCSEPGLACGYIDGAQCYCVDDGSGGGLWDCSSAPELGCPTIAPNVGTSCEKKGACHYGTCKSSSRFEFSCVKSRWTVKPGTECAAVCPLISPKIQEPCVNPNLVCRYGNDPRTLCRDRYDCKPFVFPFWLFDDPKCAPIPSGQCPASETTVSGPCAPAELICPYPNGAQCACVVGKSGPAWLCSGAPAVGCPTLAPTANQPCPASLNATVCTYGACVAKTFASLVCSGGGIWMPAGPSPC